MRLPKLVPIALLALVAAACNSTTTSTTPSVPYSQQDLTVGSGAAAATGKLVTVDYTGWLYDPSKPDNKGAQFDTTIGRTPFTFTLAAGQVIAGWEQGVPGMQVGGTRRLIIPPSLAYGSTRNGPIPPNATLIFEITLQNVQ